METALKQKGINQTTLKYIAITTMLIDHLAWAFVNSTSILGIIMHMTGRLTAPIMCFGIVQGYLHTRSLNRYIGRMAVFAVISNFAFSYFETGRFAFFPFGVIYTLLLALLAIIVYDRAGNPVLKWGGIVGLCVLSIIGDWMFFVIVFTLIFYINRDNFRKQCVEIVMTTIIMTGLMIVLMTTVGEASLGAAILENVYLMGIVFSLVAIKQYNGERGGSKRSGWFFYAFYPVHLVVLGVLRYVVIGG